MTRGFACFVIAALTCSTGLYTVASSAHTHDADGPVEILVNGAAQRRYAHQGRWYVEALNGKEYAIRLRNPYGVRVAVALSVDGLNTIDARHTTATDARKWVIEPYQTITISGWQTSRTEARRFEFTTEERSYGKALGATQNLGTISAVFFRERLAQVTQRYSPRAEARESVPPTASPAAPPAVGTLSESVVIQERAQPARKDEYAATGMGRPTDHHVVDVSLDLESAPAHSINIRYEFRPQLVRLGILPAAQHVDPLARRERGTGFAPVR